MSVPCGDKVSLVASHLMTSGSELDPHSVRVARNFYFRSHPNILIESVKLSTMYHG